MSSRNEVSIEPIDAPYNFVPLWSHVYMPPWAPQVSHDVPFRDGLCGELHISITAKTPLLCGAEPQRKDGDAAHVHFVRDANDQFYIPGSSLKGMVRAALEIGAFGRMSAVDERRFPLRDLSGKNVTYAALIKDGDIKTGFLRRAANGKPEITPCDWKYLSFAELKTYLGFTGPIAALFNGNDHKSVRAKYRQWQSLCKKHGKPSHAISFEPGITEGSYTRSVARQLGLGSKQGVPVFTGQSGVKKHDFVFHDPRPEARTEVTPVEWAAFLDAHESAQKDDDQASWAGYWRERYGNGDAVPVFYLDRPSWGRAIGLARAPRLAGDYTTHDLIKAIGENHLKQAADPSKPEYDLPELIFGTLGATQEASLASRVLFEPAYAQTAPVPADDERLSRLTVLNAPKPSFFPNYLLQTGKIDKSHPFRTWSNLDKKDTPPTLRGRKRYPVRDASQIELTQPPLDEKKGQTNSKVCVKLHPLAAGTVFNSRVVVHNLRPEELGALAWALTLDHEGASGKDHPYRHALGMGKPFGLGQLQVEINVSHLRRNDGQPAPTPREAVHAFVKLMDAFCASASKEFKDWASAPPVQAFLAMSDPKMAKPYARGGLQSGFPGQLAHMPLKNFRHAKTSGAWLAPYRPFEYSQDFRAQKRMVAQAPAPVTPVPKPSRPEAPPKPDVFMEWENAKIVFSPGQKQYELTRPPALKNGPGTVSMKALPEHVDAAWRAKLEKKREGFASVRIRVEGNKGTVVPETFKPL